MNRFYVFTTALFAVAAISASVRADDSAPAAAPVFDLTGSLQLQAQKAVYDNGTENNLDDFFGRVNIGGLFKAPDMQAFINIRAFPEGFGYEPIIGAAFDSTAQSVEIQKTKIAKFQVEQAWFKYIWGSTSLLIGRFYKTTSKSVSFGNYIDQDVPGGFQLKVYYHHAAELSIVTGMLTSSLLLGAGDSKLNTGYLRIFECIKPVDGLTIAAAYRSNAFDPIYDENAEVFNRFSLNADYRIMKDLVPYVEFGVIQKVDDEYDLPLLIGCKVPTSSILSALGFELEFLNDRKVGGDDVPVLWNIYFDKTAGEHTKFQAAVYSDPAGKSASDVRIALRMTATLK